MKSTPRKGPARWRLSLLAGACLTAGLAAPRAAAQASHVEMHVHVDSGDNFRLCERTQELLYALPVTLTCTTGPTVPAPRTPHALLRVIVVSPRREPLQVQLFAGDRGQLVRELPMRDGRADQATLEAVAAIVEGSARVLLSGQPLPQQAQQAQQTQDAPAAFDPVVNAADATGDAPTAGGAEPATAAPGSGAAIAQPAEAAVTQAGATKPPREEPTRPAPAAQSNGSSEHLESASEPESRKRATTLQAATEVSAGYAVSFFSPALAFHGPALQLLHRRPADDGAFVVAATLFVPFAGTVARDALDARLTSYLLRAMVGLESSLGQRLTLRLCGGLLAQRVTSKATRVAEGSSGNPSTDYQSFGLALAGSLHMRLTPALFVALHLGLDLDPAKLELGVTRAGRFERLFRSNRVRPHAALHAGASF